MRFSVFAPVTDGVTGDPDWMVSFAQHLERCGFESIIAAEHTYTPLGGNRIRYESDSFRADLTVDDQGFVLDYPGLARRG